MKFVMLEPTELEQEFLRQLMERDRALFEYRLDPEWFPLPKLDARTEHRLDALAYGLSTYST